MTIDRRHEFIRQTNRVLRETGFGTAAAHEASVLVFDSRVFSDFQPVMAELLDRRERARAARFRFSDDRKAYTAAHAVWRVALAQCLGTVPEDVTLATTDDGQPRLPGSALSTSLSHSGPMVAISVCAAATVGVDIESIPAKVDMEALVPMFCTRAEAQVVDAMECGEEKHRHLVELWTRKEALLKAFGVGLLTDPASTPATPDELILPPPDAAHYPACHTSNVGESNLWVAAVAVPAAVRGTSLHVL
ncbi:4'-phosphopantetheinyl transferase family protein [Luteibacter yeojuensis]|uniref:4'-phosphopantetheinyl transferase family protein n=1 Tax=Luteibacter yeojuensis TaxID=345309 RepID=UPI0006964D3F|nr:4'-phosphopantetheinyl transferase superfamily protein [Luteibacter yeojuensis]